MVKPNFFYILIFLFLQLALAHAQDSLEKKTYFREFPDKVLIRSNIINTSNEFSLYNENLKTNIEVIPNRKTTLGLSFNYDLLAFSFGFAPEIFNSNREREDGQIFAFSLNLYPGLWIQEIDFYKQNGFKVRAVDYSTTHLPSANSLKITGKTGFNFNPNFSFRAKNFENQRQLISAGSFIPAVSYAFTALRKIRVLDQVENANFYTLAINPAYYYNWVINEHFLVAGGLSIGLGAFHTSENKNSSTHLLTTSTLDLSLGYTTDSFYSGIRAYTQVQNQSSNSHAKVDDAVRYFSVVIGYRFDAPNFIKKTNEDLRRWLNSL